MAQVREQVLIGAAPSEVWKIIGDFSGMLPALGLPIELEMEGEGIGALRKASYEGNTVVERLEELDEAAWRTSYSMPRRGRMPFEDYYSTIELEPADGRGRCLLTWTSTFRAVGVSEREAEEQIRWAHGLIMDALHERFGVWAVLTDALA